MFYETSANFYQNTHRYIYDYCTLLALLPFCFSLSSEDIYTDARETSGSEHSLVFNIALS
jgi:hypothetical protein